MNDLVIQQRPFAGMREIALFAGAGGGILGGHLLGWETICAVERDAYAAAVLAQRQNDGFLRPFPIWSDVCSFDGKPWHGRADVLSGGFPCQDISVAGSGGALMETAPDSGHKWRGLLARFDLNSSMWRTAQRSLLGDSDESLETWPRSGMTRNGSAYRRENVERTISVIASGFWPTPTVCGNYNRKGASKNSGNGLATAVAMSSTKKLLEGTDAQTAKPRTWPTPTATSHKGWSPNHNRRDSDDRLDYSVERLHFTDGQQTPPKRLNPDWTEWLMGWPIFWTDTAPALQTSASTAPTGSKPSGTDRFREWQRLHSPFWPLDSVSG